MHNSSETSVGLPIWVRFDQSLNYAITAPDGVLELDYSFMDVPDFLVGYNVDGFLPRKNATFGYAETVGSWTKKDIGFEEPIDYFVISYFRTPYVTRSIADHFAVGERDDPSSLTGEQVFISWTNERNMRPDGVSFGPLTTEVSYNLYFWQKFLPELNMTADIKPIYVNNTESIEIRLSKILDAPLSITASFETQNLEKYTQLLEVDFVIPAGVRDFSIPIISAIDPENELLIEEGILQLNGSYKTPHGTALVQTQVGVEVYDKMPSDVMTRLIQAKNLSTEISDESSEELSSARERLTEVELLLNDAIEKHGEFAPRVIMDASFVGIGLLASVGAVLKLPIVVAGATLIGVVGATTWSIYTFSEKLNKAELVASDGIALANDTINKWSSLIKLVESTVKDVSFKVSAVTGALNAVFLGLDVADLLTLRNSISELREELSILENQISEMESLNDDFGKALCEIQQNIYDNIRYEQPGTIPSINKVEVSELIELKQALEGLEQSLEERVTLEPESSDDEQAAPQPEVPPGTAPGAPPSTDEPPELFDQPDVNLRLTENFQGGNDITLGLSEQLTADLGTSGIDRVYFSGEGTVVLPDNIEHILLTGPGNTSVIGNALNNHMMVGEGDNDLDGGGGVDTVFFNVVFDDVTITSNSDGALIVSSIGIGTNTLSNIEILRFNDRVVLTEAPQGQYTEAGIVFDEVFYLAQNPDVASAVEQGIFAVGLDHFEQFGAQEGRLANVLFDELFYLDQNPDVA